MAFSSWKPRLWHRFLQAVACLAGREQGYPRLMLIRHGLPREAVHFLPLWRMLNADPPGQQEIDFLKMRASARAESGDFMGRETRTHILVGAFKVCIAVSIYYLCYSLLAFWGGDEWLTGQSLYLLLLVSAPLGGWIFHQGTLKRIYQRYTDIFGTLEVLLSTSRNIQNEKDPHQKRGERICRKLQESDINSVREYMEAILAQGRFPTILEMMLLSMINRESQRREYINRERGTFTNWKTTPK